MMGSVVKFFDRLCKSPATVRFVTCFVLMISETDFVFSFLFASNMLQVGWPYTFFVAIMGVGLCTYFLGVWRQGPRNKYDVIRRVRKYMELTPDQCKDERGNPVNGSTKINPQLPPTHPFKDFTFASFGDRDNDIDDEIMLFFKSGLVKRNLIHVWDSCDRDNAINTCERVHGTPFIRLASFGFMSQPSPRDLGGILNANTLYTFCTGILQLFGGSFYMVSQEQWIFDVLMPLGISAASLALSLANVFLNFSSILTSIEAEQALRDDILAQNKASLKRDKDNARREHEESEKKIKEEIALSTAEHKFTREQELMKDAFTLYTLRLRSIEDRQIQIISAEIQGHRYRTQQVSAAMRADMSIKQSDVGAQSSQYTAAKEKLETKVQQLKDKKNQMIDDLSVELSADETAKQLKAIDAEFDYKISLFAGRIAQLNPSEDRKDGTKDPEESRKDDDTRVSDSRV